MRGWPSERVYPGERNEGIKHPKDRGQVLPQGLSHWDDLNGWGWSARGKPAAPCVWPCCEYVTITMLLNKPPALKYEDSIFSGNHTDTWPLKWFFFFFFTHFNPLIHCLRFSVDFCRVLLAAWIMPVMALHGALWVLQNIVFMPPASTPWTGEQFSVRLSNEHL